MQQVATQLRLKLHVTVAFEIRVCMCRILTLYYAGLTCKNVIAAKHPVQVATGTARQSVQGNDPKCHLDWIGLDGPALNTCAFAWQSIIPLARRHS